ncbi:MAG: hypothetical protein ACYS8W_07985 [Planctomycetota bacterium]|jgi:thioredoxin-related protein
MESVLTRPEISDELSSFEHYKVDISLLNKKRRKRYRVKGAPTLVFIDATGKILKTWTSTRTKPEVMERLLQMILKTSDKNLAKLKKKQEEAKK